MEKTKIGELVCVDANPVVGIKGGDVLLVAGACYAEFEHSPPVDRSRWAFVMHVDGTYGLYRASRFEKVKCTT